MWCSSVKNTFVGADNLQIITNKFVDKILKKHILCISSELLLFIHKVPTTDSLVLFSRNISRTALSMQASVIVNRIFRAFLVFVLFKIYSFIVQRLFWKIISAYFLWFDCWPLNVFCCHVYFSFFLARFLNTCKARTPFYVFWRDGPPGLALYGSWKKINHFARLSHQIRCFFTWADHSI